MNSNAVGWRLLQTPDDVQGGVVGISSPGLWHENLPRIARDRAKVSDIYGHEAGRGAALAGVLPAARPSRRPARRPGGREEACRCAHARGAVGAGPTGRARPLEEAPGEAEAAGILTMTALQHAVTRALQTGGARQIPLLLRPHSG